MSEALVDVSAYISASLSDEGEIHRLRDELFSRVGLGSDFRLSEAHLTIIPSFEVSGDCTPVIDKKLAELHLEGRELIVNGVGVWPSIRNPRVVLLDCTIDLEAERDELLRVLRDVGVRELPEPVAPHITLFKCDNGHELEKWRKEEIQQVVIENRETWTTTIRYADLVIVK